MAGSREPRGSRGPAFPPQPAARRRREAVRRSRDRSPVRCRWTRSSYAGIGIACAAGIEKGVVGLGRAMNAIEHFASPLDRVETPPGGNSLLPWARRPSLCLPQPLMHAGRGRPESSVASPGGNRRAGCQRTASLASMMAMTASSRLPLALIKVCSRWRSWWWSPARSS